MQKNVDLLSLSRIEILNIWLTLKIVGWKCFQSLPWGEKCFQITWFMGSISSLKFNVISVKDNFSLSYFRPYHFIICDYLDFHCLNSLNKATVSKETQGLAS